MFSLVGHSKAEQKKMMQVYQNDPIKEAESAAYKEADGTLFIPSRCLAATLKAAAKIAQRVEGSGLKMGRFDIPMSQRIAGSVVVEPQNPPLLDPKDGTPLSKYEVQLDKVRIGQSSIIRGRARVDAWACKFDLVWNPLLYDLQPADLKNALNFAGNIGVLDWRPTYGTFKVTDVQEAE
jgi:hypothetical protein